MWVFLQIGTAGWGRLCVPLDTIYREPHFKYQSVGEYTDTRWHVVSLNVRRQYVVCCELGRLRLTGSNDFKSRVVLGCNGGYGYGFDVLPHVAST